MSQLVTIGEFRQALDRALAASDDARALICIREAQKDGDAGLEAAYDRVLAARIAGSVG